MPESNCIFCTTPQSQRISKHQANMHYIKPKALSASYAGAALLFIALLSLNACGRKNKDLNSVTEENPFVYGYTSGVISKADPIRVRFNADVATAKDVGKEAPSGLLSFSPSIRGKATWEDRSTLRFTPDEPLNSGETYSANLNVKKILSEARGEDADFAFQFHTRELHYQVDLDGMRPVNTQDYAKQSIKGAVYTTDVADNADVEKIVAAKQNGDKLDIQWQHNAANLVHSFTVKAVSRGSQPSEVKLAYDGGSIGAKEEKSEVYKIPAVSEFVAMSAEVVQLPEQYAIVTFSDPLNKSQNLDGLISIENYAGTLRFIIEENTVRVYPEQVLQGDYRIQVNAGIENTQGKRFNRPSVWDVTFEDQKPQIKLSGKGVILPSTDGLMFPFEAVGLKAIDVEIFKIYNDNILQFLQDNNLDGEYELHKVGKILVQKRIDLQSLSPNAKAGRMSRYALDLSKLIQKDEQAIYQVRIGFRSEYSNMACAQTNQDADLLGDPFARDPESDEEEASILDSYYGPDGYFEDYDWEKRSDPCAREYYNSEHFIQRNVISSNLGLIAKRGGNRKVMVVATDLRDTDPISGAEVEVFDFQQQSIGKGSTNGDGIAEIELKGSPYVAIAKHNGQRGYIRMAEGDVLSLSRFDVSGDYIQKGLKGLIYGERGVWRPGDSVFLNFMVNDLEKRLPSGYPISMEVYNARGQLQEKRTTSKSVGGIYPLHFDTKDDDPTGNWSVKVKAGGANFERIIKIETVKPNRLKIDLNTGGDGERLQASEGSVRAGIKADWLTGSPAGGLRAVVEAQVRPMGTSFKKYPSYVFDDPARRLKMGEPKVVFDSELDGNGQGNFSALLLEDAMAPGMLQVSFQTRVFEKGGDFSTDNVSLPYSPYPAYAGIEVPSNQYGEPRVELGKSKAIRLVCVDQYGRPLANRQLKLGLYRVEWRWWWDQFQEDQANYNSGEHVNALQTADLVTNSKGEATWTMKPDKWGRYLIRVCEQGGHCSGAYVYSGYPWYDEEGEDGGQAREFASMLSISSDKEKYKVGDMATLVIPGSKKGRVLVSLENGTKIVKTFWDKTDEGEHKIKFKITPDMAPNVYANVALIQPHGQVFNDLPIRLYGVVPIEVEDPGTILEPVLGSPDEFRPETTVAVEVSEKSGKAMAYTLAIVDEGLLGLTRFKVPNPHKSFYAREALGVQTWDIYDLVLGAFAGQLERILSIGGDGAIDPSALNNTANRFEPMVRHLGPFQLKAGSKNKHQIAIPNYIGAVRVMVVAAGAAAYGAAEKSVPVRNPLMVQATVPRTISPGDQFELPVNVFVTDKKISDVQVKVVEQNGLAEVEGTTQNMKFSRSNSDQITGFKVKMKEKTGVAKFLITASGGGINSRQEVEVDVRNPNPYQTQVFAEVLEAGKAWETDFTPLGTAGTREAVLEVSNVPPLNLGDRLRYLLGYPYGCMEQTTSTAFPQLYVEKLMELTPEQVKSTKENIVGAINRLKSFQTAEGGFAYWPGQPTPDHWATNYGGHFLLEAKAQGYDVPENLLKDWAKFQKKVSRMWDSKLPSYGFWSQQGHELNQAYRLYTLALAGSPDMASMNRLRESTTLTPTARWRLAAAYALAGKEEVAKKLIESESTEVKPYIEMSYTYGSDTRDRAMILETLVLLNEQKRAASVVQYISKQLSGNGWYSTQSVAYSLLAVAKYVGENKVNQAFSFDYALAGGQSTSGNSKKPVMQIQLPVNTGGTRKLSFKNTSKGKLFARLILRGQPSAGQEQAQSNDLKITVTYLSTDGASLDPGNLPQGKDFVVEVKIMHPRTRPVPYDELALTQVFPSGWEIINQRMSDVQGASSSPFDYQDIRDDRVNTFFDLGEGNAKSFRTRVNAAYPGRFYLPAVSCAAMYDQSVSANTKGQWVQVTAR